MTAHTQDLLQQAQTLLEQDEAAARQLIERTLQTAAPDDAVRGQLHHLLGLVEKRQGQGERAVTHLKRAFDLLQANGDLAAAAQARRDLGAALLEQGRYREAEEHLKAVLDTEQTDSLPDAETLNLLAGLYYATGRSDESLDSLQAARIAFSRTGDVLGEVKVLGNLGTLLTSLGRYPEALEHLQRAYWLGQDPAHEGLAGHRSQGAVLITLGVLHLNMGSLPEAGRYFQEALDFAERAGDQVIASNAVLNLAEVQHQQGDLAAAQATYQQALERGQTGGFRHFEASALRGLGQLAIQEERWEEAERVLDLASEIAQEDDDVEGQLEVLLELGQVRVAQQNLTGALETLEGALNLAQQSSRPKAACDLQRALYPLYAEQGDLPRALATLERLYTTERELQSADAKQQVERLTHRMELERAQHQTELTEVRLQVAEEARSQAEDIVRDRTRSLELAQLEVVNRLAVAAEYRDHTTGNHTWRVGEMSAALARRLGLSQEAVALIRIAARLHDVGKIGIPDSILLKEGPLTPEEFRRMQTHCEIGGRILSGGESELLRVAEEIARSHHERWDGAGYPQGLAGAAIPLTARIVTVADVYDALTHNRPYKKAWNHDRARRELARLSGEAFDPAVVEAALELFPLSSIQKRKAQKKGKA